MFFSNAKKQSQEVQSPQVIQRIQQQLQEDEFVDVKTTHHLSRIQSAADESSQPVYSETGVPSQRKEMVRLQPQRNRKICLALPSQDSVLPKVVSAKSISEIDSQLRDELLREREKGRHEGTLAEYKHFYAIAATAGISFTETSVPLANPGGGTSVSSRTGNTIGYRRSTVRIKYEAVAAGLSTTTPRPFKLHLLFWRDKVPATPGTAPTIKGTDTNPPISTTFIFSRLGQGSAAYDALLVRNPITEDSYHIYHYSSHEVNMAQGSFRPTDTADGDGVTASKVLYKEIEIPLHGVQQIYPNYASTASETNNLWFTYWADVDITGMGFTHDFSYSIDTEFYDIQT